MTRTLDDLTRGPLVGIVAGVLGASATRAGRSIVSAEGASSVVVGGGASADAAVDDPAATGAIAAAAEPRDTRGRFDTCRFVSKTRTVGG